ncbi:hypothetical protein BH09SUM1_BH09SUM1_29970 [soil metagenome]
MILTFVLMKLEDPNEPKLNRTRNDMSNILVLNNQKALDGFLKTVYDPFSGSAYLVLQAGNQRAVISTGPDGAYNPAWNPADLSQTGPRYDPTNGALSSGDIWVTLQ